MGNQQKVNNTCTHSYFLFLKAITITVDMIISFVHQIHSYSSMFNVHVHARSRWLGWFFSFPPWCIIFFSTLLLLKPAPARETSAQLVIFISSSIILKHFKHQTLQISSMKIDLLFRILYCRCNNKWRIYNCNKH